jgi:hypothetical protein
MSTAVARQQTGMTLFEQYTDESKFNILRPTETVMTAQSPFTIVYGNIIRFEKDADTYKVDGGKLALNKTAHDKIASAAGISFVDVQRTDNRNDPDFAEVKVIAVMKRADGTLITATGTKSVDVNAMIDRLGPDSDKVKNRKQLRQFKVERAESGAKNRAIRALMAIKASYLPAELAKPFVVPQITTNYELIMQDPELRRLAGAQQLGAMGMLYPQQNPSLSTTQPQNAGALPAGSSSPVKELPAAVVTETRTAPDDDPPPLPFDDEPPALDENPATLRKLFNEREHNYSETALEKMIAAPAEKQIGYIDLFAGFPMKKQSTPTNGAGNKSGLSDKQIGRLFGIAKSAGYDSDGLHAVLARECGGITSVNDITREQYDRMCGDEEKEIPSWLKDHPFVGGAQ